MPAITSRTSSGGSSGPRHSPYPVWLEKTTVSTGHTSCPSRWRGKVAAELPTWPYATNDWIDKKRISPSWHPSEDRPVRRCGALARASELLSAPWPSVRSMKRFVDEDLSGSEFRECDL